MGLNWAVQPESLEMNEQAHARERTEPVSETPRRTHGSTQAQGGAGRAESWAPGAPSQVRLRSPPSSSPNPASSGYFWGFRGFLLP